MTTNTTCDGPECDAFECHDQIAHRTLEQKPFARWMSLYAGGGDTLHFCDIECLFKWAYYEGGFDKGIPQWLLDAPCTCGDHAVGCE